jgi:hypothetical protein
MTVPSTLQAFPETYLALTNCRSLSPSCKNRHPSNDPYDPHQTCAPGRSIQPGCRALSRSPGDPSRPYPAVRLEYDALLRRRIRTTNCGLWRAFAGTASRLDRSPELLSDPDRSVCGRSVSELRRWAGAHLACGKSASIVCSGWHCRKRCSASSCTCGSACVRCARNWPAAAGSRARLRLCRALQDPRSGRLEPSS